MGLRKSDGAAPSLDARKPARPPGYSPPTTPRSPPASSAPSAWRRQHGQIEAPDISSTAFRPYFRSRSQLDKLLSQRAISEREWQAADRFRRLYELAHHSELRGGAYDRVYVDQHCRRPGQAEPSDVRLAAIEKLVRIRRTLGPIVFGIAVEVAVHDTCWAQLARKLGGIDPKTARSRGVEAIAVLAAA
jgi:hypothetical protein